MAYAAKQRHKYKPAIQTEYNFIKTGERVLFWGLITYPTGYTEKKEYDTGICKYCFKPLVDRLHGDLPLPVDRYE